MSAADLIVPGFYGKMPATGDFVTRRLPADFVRGWDRWLARHIVPLFGLKTWPQHIALRFLSGPGSFGASAGIVLQSADRVGRQFPLSVVARLPKAPLKLAFADAWFESIETLALAAQQGELTPDELDAALAALPVPLIDDEGDLIDEFVAWTAHTDIFDVDQLAPRPTLEQIFAASWETS
ncbi:MULTISPECIES: type VI secretion system-associated protein TagF [Mesorhizobium]|uniref:Type VI secretion system-associated protein TagF n=1 Tax=Mesorhizobium japonicum R7A TaxID=935547 RepID=A0ABX6MTU4_9HYPH|nr:MULTISPECIES: type VI secretion system-associated protein TagF [Mesorhizobium]MBE1710982.1 type VI secretion system-associated protein TagF [Mesorhizobium japonicum]MBE1715350.1 type VI secretion system-associated protein TagF [Mesorhizobium japonicum]MUT21936.1 type VI secretion system-associated protein TagF [Mesorhizobium japonicum]MUT27787.1 type VI secretion system-associated protein TagF [Mesorhizobium japonicum]PBB15968.1 type VI secretion system-associated protein TagF [Mesorhizobiu